jgi:hypothetical protein
MTNVPKEPVFIACMPARFLVFPAVTTGYAQKLTRLESLGYSKAATHGQIDSKPA